MKQRHKKVRAAGLRIALSRAHTKLASEAYELDLSRRAIESLQRHGQLERARARDRQIDMANEIDTLRRRMAQVQSVVHDACIALGSAPMHDMRIEEHDFMSTVRYSFWPEDLRLGDSNTVVDARRHSQMMRILRFRAVHERLARMTHFKVSLRNKAVGYAISDEAIDQTPIEVLRDSIAREIADRIADHLVKELRRPGYRDLDDSISGLRNRY